MQTWLAGNSLPALPQPAAGALAADALSQLAQEAVQQLLREGESTNTLASYRAGLRYWSAWFVMRYGQTLTLPVPTPVVLQFVVDHVQRLSTSGTLVHDLPPAVDHTLVAAGVKGRGGALALATVEHRLAILSKLHTVRGEINPCTDPSVRELMGRVRRAYSRRGVRPAKKAPLLRESLETVLATCDASPIGVRDRALLLFAWCTGGRRRSEVAQADMRDLSATGDGDFFYELRVSKTNQAGAERPENMKPVIGAAAAALRTWLELAGIREGPIFRRVDKGGRIGPSLSPAAVRKIVMRRCTQAGVTGNFGAHSLRSGFISEALRCGVPAAEAMQLTGHRDVGSLLSYFGANGTLSAQAQRIVKLE